MKFRQTILARSIRQVTAIGTGAPRADVIRKIKEKYQFLKAPERYEEMFPNPLLQPPPPITFQGGKFSVGKRDFGIVTLQFLPGMFFVDTQTDTDDADLVLDDYIATANKENPESIIPSGPTYYLSQIEVNMEKVPDLPSPYQDAAQIIDRFLADYGLSVPKYGFWATHLNLDTHGLGVMAPAFFALERRVGFPFNAKVFFSQAPLRTKDHIAVLEKLDSIIH